MAALGPPLDTKVDPTPGLTCRRKGEHLETVTTKSGVFGLVTTHPGIEVHEGTISPGKYLTLVPYDESQKGGVEICLVLQGTLQADIEQERIAVGPGDMLIADGLEDLVRFQAASEARFLYISTEPTFHQISAKLKELMRLAAEVETKDGYTAGHCQRVKKLALETGRELGLSHTRLRDLAYAAYLHGIGKARIPVRILAKRGGLTEEEWDIMRMHPAYGREIMERTFMRTAARIVEQHHELLDGSGYPHGLRGDQILVESMIVAVADRFDSMISERPYRRAGTPGRALEELQAAAGRLYPAEVVEALHRVAGQS